MFTRGALALLMLLAADKFLSGGQITAEAVEMLPQIARAYRL